MKEWCPLEEVESDAYSCVKEKKEVGKYMLVGEIEWYRVINRRLKT